MAVPDLVNCESCGKHCEKYRGFPAWCSCGWRVPLDHSTTSLSRFDSYLKKQRDKRGENVIRYVLRSGPRPRKVSFRRLAVYFIVLLCIAPPVLLTIAGVWFCTKTTYGPFPYVLACVCFLFAWALRPRSGRTPKGTISRQEAPALFEVLDLISGRIDSPLADFVLFDDSVVAATGSYGLRGRRVVHLSPVFGAVLTPAELTGLLAHELGHSGNGDPVRARLVFVAISTLARLQRIVEPFNRPSIMPFVHLVAMVLNGLLLSVSHMLIRLTWWERQCAELRADLFGLRVSGVDAFTNTFAKFQYKDEINDFVRSRANASDPNLLAELRAAYRFLPDSVLELARMRWQVERRAANFDASHPPTRDRVEFANRCVGQIEGVERAANSDLDPLLAAMDDEMARLSAGPLNNIIQTHRSTAAEINFR